MQPKKIKNKNIYSPVPQPPLDRVWRNGGLRMCNICHSTMHRTGFLGLFGEFFCDNNKCPNGKGKSLHKRNLKLNNENMKKAEFKQLLEDYKENKLTTEEVVEIFFNASTENNELQKEICPHCGHDSIIKESGARNCSNPKCGFHLHKM
jgi:hypothetical protein